MWLIRLVGTFHSLGHLIWSIIYHLRWRDWIGSDDDANNGDRNTQNLILESSHLCCWYSSHDDVWKGGKCVRKNTESGGSWTRCLWNRSPVSLTAASFGTICLFIMMPIQNLATDNNIWRELKKVFGGRPYSCMVLAWLVLQPWWWRQYVPLKSRRYIPENSKLHGHVSSSRRVGCGSAGANIVSGGSEIYWR